MEPPDQELVQRFRAGDGQAFDELVERWGPSIWRLAWRLTGDANDAQDVRQMTLMRAYSALDSFNGEASLSTWLYRVVLNLCRDRLRGERARERATLDAGRRLNGNGSGHAPGPEHELQAAEAARRIASAIDELPREEREVVVLRHYHDLSFPEIAEVLGAPATTVKSRMTRGLERLRSSLKGIE